MLLCGDYHHVWNAWIAWLNMMEFFQLLTMTQIQPLPPNHSLSIFFWLKVVWLCLVSAFHLENPSILKGIWCVFLKYFRPRLSYIEFPSIRFSFLVDTQKEMLCKWTLHFLIEKWVAEHFHFGVGGGTIYLENYSWNKVDAINY